MGRFMRKGTSEFYFVPTVASLNAPTVANITAGEDLTPDLAEIAGFEFTNSPIVTPDMATTFSTQIPGEDTAAESSMTFYEDDAVDDIMTTLAKGTDGFIVIFPQGTATGAVSAGDIAEVWPVTVASNSRQYTAENEAAKFRVMFSVTSEPDQTATIAA